MSKSSTKLEKGFTYNLTSHELTGMLIIPALLFSPIKYCEFDGDLTVTQF